MLTSSEIYALLEEHGTRLQGTPPSPLDAFPGAPASEAARSWPGGSGEQPPMLLGLSLQQSASMFTIGLPGLHVEGRSSDASAWSGRASVSF